MTGVTVWAEECSDCQNKGELTLTWHNSTESESGASRTLLRASAAASTTIGDASVTMTYMKSFKQEKNQWSDALSLDNPVLYTHDSKILFHLASIKHTNNSDSESWNVEFVRPDGRVISFTPFYWYKSYQDKSSCFVWGNNIIAENTTVLASQDGWIEDTRCCPSGAWSLRLLHDSVVIGTVNFTMRVGCDTNSIVSGATYNQGSYGDRTNELHHMDSACRNKGDKVSHTCNKTLYPNEYNTTIRNTGCALTSCCIMLNFYGIEVTPPELNAWLKEKPDGYFAVGNINWERVAQYAREHDINLRCDGRISSAQLTSYLCNYGPQVVGVKNDHHWVCLYGKDVNSNWVISDPNGGVKNTLNSLYSSGFNSIKGFSLSTIPYTPLPGLTIIARCPVEMLVTDSQGRRTGYDPITGQSYNEIPGADYYYEGEEDCETGEVSDDVTKFLDLNDIDPDTYTVTVTGTGTGKYDLYFYGYSTDEKATTEAFEQIGTTQNLVHTYQVKYDGTPGSKINVTGGVPSQTDQTPPVTTADYPSNWVNQDVRVTFAATDNKSGVKETFYRLDGADWKNGNQLDIAAEGAHNLDFYSVDQAGNTEAPKTIIVKIDKTAPKTDIVIAGDRLTDGSYKSSAMVTLTALDTTSGVKAIYYRLGSQTNDTLYTAPIVIDQEGQSDLSVYALDQAGNRETVQYVKIIIVKTGDLVPPITLPNYPTDWVNDDVSVTLTATDDSGVKNTYFRVDGGEWRIGDQFTIESDGVHTIDFYSVDVNGNIEKTKTIIVKIDKTAPQTQATISGLRLDDGSYSGTATITLSATDNGSGVKTTYYRLNAQGTHTLYTGPFVVNNEGQNTLYVYTVDQVGNWETSRSYTISISKTAPASHYAFLCNQLTIYGNINGNTLYCNGTINIYGNGQWDALGTSENSFMITGQQQIANIVTSGAKQSLPQPNWQAINQVTTERNETQINVNSVLTNLRFQTGLMISGTTKIKSILVVKGDLTFNGNVGMEDACLICTGKVTINGSTGGTGLIYAGNGLTVWGNCNISGEVMINGPVTMAGTETFLSGDVRKYLPFLQ